MFALFLALTAALGLLLWAEVSPTKAQARTKAAPQSAPVPAFETLIAARAQATLLEEDDTTLMARLAALFDDPEAEALPQIAGYRPGDVIELELDGPAPRAEDIAFEQAGHDTRVLIEGFPALVVQRVRAATLSPAVFRFRSPQLA